METRTFTDDDGRRSAGSLMSGRFAGGEEQAEVMFVCEDVLTEAKRFARLDPPPAEAAERWRGLDDGALRDLFRSSQPA